METAKPVSPSTTDVWLNTCSSICGTLGLHSLNRAPLKVSSEAGRDAAKGKPEELAWPRSSPDRLRPAEGAGLSLTPARQQSCLLRP